MSAAAVIKIAKSQVGYQEKRSNADLDSMTGNAGYNNYTKYARDLYDAGYYNGNKNGYAWCDVFVDWCFYRVYGKQKGQEVECQTGSLGAGCYYSVQYYKAQGRYDHTPQVGDQIFFSDSDGDPCHTGLVYAVDRARVYTVEGNTSGGSGLDANGGCVALKSYPLDYGRIHGYGHPKYEEAATSGTVTAETRPAATTEEEFDVAKIYHNGSTPEPVYADTARNVRIGSLNPWESCDCIGTVDGMYIVRYRVDGTSHYKVGVVEYSGGVR